ncbi:hypothetical protein N0V88_003595 [Collariella sp. IMI 366227]|nr:hypothetical protein N0V88_003595 [Collariella sp. IMI 366227]
MPRYRGTPIHPHDEDDDDFDSDDDFPSLFPEPPRSTLPPPPARKETKVYETPRAKRRALEFHSSPLTVNFRHKFDIKALLKHAEQEKALEEKERCTAALLAEGSPSVQRTRPIDGASPSLHDTMLGLLSDPDGSQDEASRSRLLRAVQRTEATVQRKEWHFFDQQRQPDSTAIEVRTAFPKTAATGPWAFLAPEDYRSEAFEDGLPFHVQTKLGSLPDDLFRWVLNEATHETSQKLGDEYVRLLSACPDQTRRVMDDKMILELFRTLGASERALGEIAQPKGTPAEGGAPYPEHGWHRLRTVLRIISGTAHGMKVESLTKSMSILLRLGIDNIVREDLEVVADYQDALLQLVRAVPWKSWNTFCGNVGDSLYFHTPYATLRWNAVSSIPPLHPRLIELRRRLALVFVFNDRRRALSPPAESFKVRSLSDRLDQADEFLIDRNKTDWFELLALAEMLSVAVGDGSPPAAAEAKPEAIKEYDADVDELSHIIKYMWSNIHEQGAAYMSRLEVRVQLKDFERKLQHSVRMRPPPKEDIFGLQIDDDEVERPKQQQFMKKFLAKTNPPKTL